MRGELGRMLAELQEKGEDISNTAGRNRKSLEGISNWKWQRNSNLSLSIISQNPSKVCLFK